MQVRLHPGGAGIHDEIPVIAQARLQGECLAEAEPAEKPGAGTPVAVVALAVLHGGLFVPNSAAKPFTDAILDWTESANVDEFAVLSGVPIPHGPDDHRTFHVSTRDYFDARVADADPAIDGMGNGFLDGVDAALVERGMVSDLAVGVFLTPVHDRVPDVDAAIRLVDTITRLYDLDVDTGPLEAFAADVAAYYERLHERLEAIPDNERPEDRMFN